MQLRLPLWYILVLLWAFLLKGRAAPVSCRTSSQTRNDDDDSDSDSDSDDDDDDSNSNSQHHRNGCPTIGSGEQRGLSKGAVAGIVIGILLLLLLLILLACWMQRRRRRSRSRQGIEVAVATVAPPPPAKEHSSSRSNSAHPPTLRPQSMIAQHLSNTAPGGVILSDSMGRHHWQTRELNNVPRTAAESTESVALPNPYEQDRPPTPPPRDDSVTSPASTMSRYASLYSTTSGPTEETHSRTRSYSAVPSAWTHDDSTTPLLSRGTTQASRLTASSSLHEEMAGYQKALEAHHRKEQDDAQQRESRIGQGSAVPEDPPPVYRDREELL
ncbi:hypothetical protein C2E23DRAFT_724863 [Lenzites betulinus]|nr:hypothetical protein C2E23DRAFT_724863 [Lenzites betulinus]